MSVRHAHFQKVNREDTGLVLRAGSRDSDPVKAAREIHRQLAACDAACIVFFCSADYRLDLLADELSKLFEPSRLIGCTSAGEVTPFGISSNSISAFALPGGDFAIETVLIENLAQFSEEEAKVLVHDMLGALGEHYVSDDPEQSFALSLLDGMSIREEFVLQALTNGLQGIPLVGGSAGDNLHFVDTKVYHNGGFHSNAAVIALINTRLPFRVFSHHHLIPESERLVVTSADPRERVVHEFNAEPAALEYCRVCGLTLDELSPTTFALHPLGVQLGHDTYIRSLQQVNDDMSLSFFCAIDLGVVLTKMRSSGLVEHTRNVMDTIRTELGRPQLVIGYDCIHRRNEIDALNLNEKMSQIYRENNVVGFNSYGEQRDGMHVNHTLSGVAIGSPTHEQS